MKKLNLYIASTILYTSFIMVLIVSSIFFLFTYIAQVGDIGRTQTSFSLFVYVLYDIPANLYLVMPACGLLGALTGLSLLSQNNELIVIRTSGYSMLEIAKGIATTASFLAILTFLIGSYVSPYLQKKIIINKLLSIRENDTPILYNTQSLWSHENNTFVHIDSNSFNQPMINITKYNLLNNMLTSVCYGENAYYQNKKWYFVT